jgi:hypothetical protein
MSAAIATTNGSRDPRQDDLTRAAFAWRDRKPRPSQTRGDVAGRAYFILSTITGGVAVNRVGGPMIFLVEEPPISVFFVEAGLDTGILTKLFEEGV